MEPLPVKAILESPCHPPAGEFETFDEDSTGRGGLPTGRFPSPVAPPGTDSRPHPPAPFCPNRTV